MVRMVRRVVLAAVAVAALASIAGLSPAQAAGKWLLTVRLALDQEVADRVVADTKPEAVALCGSGIENQYGIGTGTRVIVKDGNGNILAVAPIKKINVKYIGPNTYDQPLWECNYTAKMSVPIVRFYTVEIDGHAGPIYTYSELRKQGNRMDLTM